MDLSQSLLKLKFEYLVNKSEERNKPSELQSLKFYLHVVVSDVSQQNILIIGSQFVLDLKVIASVNVNTVNYCCIEPLLGILTLVMDSSD